MIMTVSIKNYEIVLNAGFIKIKSGSIF